MLRVELSLLVDENGLIFFSPRHGFEEEANDKRTGEEEVLEMDRENPSGRRCFFSRQALL